MDRETVEEIKRHFGIVAEDLRRQVQAVAEGQQLLVEGQQGLRRELETFRSEVAREFDETRSLIRLSYGELDRRMRGLEGEVADLRARVDRLEDRRAS